MYTESEISALNELTKNLVKGLTPDDPKQAIDALTKVINYHDWRYYSLSDSILTDIDYDKMFKALSQLEQDHPELINANSPTQRVARSLNEDFESVEHLVPMLSLDNS